MPISPFAIDPDDEQGRLARRTPSDDFIETHPDLSQLNHNKLDLFDRPGQPFHGFITPERWGDVNAPDRGLLLPFTYTPREGVTDGAYLDELWRRWRELRKGR